MYVAFFGGALAIAVIAILNSRRLPLATTKQRMTLAIGVLGFVVTLLAAYLATLLNIAPTWRPGSTGFRVLARVLAVITYLALYRAQRSGERIYTFQNQGGFASLWGPGLTAVFGLNFVQNWIILNLLPLLLP
ncbi:MAG: hypothetical protein AB1791_07220 [Chloroflexota bacterium]